MAQTALIQSAVRTCEGGHFPIHAHNAYQLLLIFGGCAHAEIGTAVYDICEPTALFISNLENHSISYGDGVCPRVTVTLSPTELSEKLHSKRLLSAFVNHAEGHKHAIPLGSSVNEFATLASVLADEYERNDDRFPDAAFQIFKLILLRLARLSPEAFPYVACDMTETVERVRRYLETSANEVASLPEIAAEFHTSPCYLSHSFKLYTGYSITRYRLLFRIACAREYLADETLSIAEVAMMTGFSDMSNFSRFFKREVGCTPSAYRLACREETKNQTLREERTP